MPDTSEVAASWFLFVLGLLLQGWVSCFFVARRQGRAQLPDRSEVGWLTVPSVISIFLTAGGAIRLAHSWSFVFPSDVIMGPLAFVIVGAAPITWHNRRVATRQH